MYHAAGKILWLNLSGIAVDADIPKTLKCKAWLIKLFAAALQDILNRLLRTLQVSRIKVSVSIQHLRMAQDHVVTCVSLHMEADKADHVLSEVQYRLTIRCTEQPCWFQFVHDTRRQRLLRNQNVLRIFQLLYTTPF